jgi:hypothetical protein
MAPADMYKLVGHVYVKDDGSRITLTSVRNAELAFNDLAEKGYEWVACAPDPQRTGGHFHVFKKV